MVINEFRGPFRFLSNFFECTIVFEDMEYGSVEHAYQAMKSLEPSVRQEISKMATPGRAKRAGRRIQLRDDWNQVREALMEKIVRDKFTRNIGLKTLLLKTGSVHLVEGNSWHDNFWGDCQCWDCKNFRGKNNLGEILMKVRDELRKGQ